jgi:glutamyl-tRNA synthetase
LPQALLNYLARLGWSHGDQEIFSGAEMIAAFDIEDINKSAAAFDLDKLLWVNQHYIAHLPLAELVTHATPYFVQAGLDASDAAQLAAVVDAQRTRAKTLVEMADKSRPFFGELSSRDEEAMAKHLVPAVAAPLRDLRDQLVDQQPWQAPALHTLIESVASSHDIKLGKIAQPLRVAVTGSTASPAIDVTLQLVGRQQCLTRIDSALAYIASRADAA